MFGDWWLFRLVLLRLWRCLDLRLRPTLAASTVRKQWAASEQEQTYFFFLIYNSTSVVLRASLISALLLLLYHCSKRDR